MAAIKRLLNSLSSTKGASETKDMIVVAADLGNRAIKFSSRGGEVTVYESIHKDLIGPKIPAINSQSCLIEYLRGYAPLEGKRWIVGSSAKDTRKYTNTFNVDKADIALKLGLACIQPSSPGEERIVIQAFCTSLPNPDERPSDQSSGCKTVRDVVTQALLGQHEFKRNGVHIYLDIQNVKVEPEGVGTYRYAGTLRMVPSGCVVGVIDLGGRTAIATLFNEAGDLIPESRLVFATGGSYELARSIAKDLSDLIKDEPHIDVILDAIATGDLRYGQTGVSFQDWFDEYRLAWFDAILAQVDTSWQEFKPRIGRVLITGGAAPLVEDLIGDDPFFKIVPNSQVANVLGLLMQPSVQLYPAA